MSEMKMQADPTNIKRIITAYYEQCHTHKFHNLDEIDKVLERHKLSQLTKEETVNLK